MLVSRVFALHAELFKGLAQSALAKGKATHISKSKIRPRDDSEVEDDFEDDSHLYVPDNIHKLEFEVEGSLKQQGVRMGDIIPKPDDPEDA